MQCHEIQIKGNTKNKCFLHHTTYSHQWYLAPPGAQEVTLSVCLSVIFFNSSLRLSFARGIMTESLVLVVPSLCLSL